MAAYCFSKRCYPLNQTGAPVAGKGAVYTKEAFGQKVAYLILT